MHVGIMGMDRQLGKTALKASWSMVKQQHLLVLHSNTINLQAEMANAVMDEIDRECEFNANYMVMNPILVPMVRRVFPSLSSSLFITTQQMWMMNPKKLQRMLRKQKSRDRRRNR